MKNKKKLLFRIIVLISLAAILLFIISLNLNVKLDIVVDYYSEYVKEIENYTDEFDKNYEVYFLDHKEAKAIVLIEGVPQEIEYSALDEQIKNVKALSEKIANEKIIVFNYEKIRNQQAKGYYVFLISQSLEYMICDKYGVTLSSLESVYEEPIMPRFAFFEMTKFINYYMETKNEEYLKNAKYYYNLYTKPTGDYSGLKEYQINYKTLNVRSYCQFVVYNLFNDGDKKKALDELLGYYDYYKSYYDEVIPKFLEGDYAGTFVLFLMDFCENNINLNECYLDIYFKEIEEKKIDDDLNSLQIVKAYYQKLYEKQKELVEEFETELKENLVKVTVESSKITILEVENYVTVDNQKFGGYVQLLLGDVTIISGEGNISLNGKNLIVHNDKTTIVFYIHESCLEGLNLSGEKLNLDVEGIKITDCKFEYNYDLKEIMINEKD